MPGPLPQHVTELLTDWEGDQAALQALIPMLYDELRRTAHRYLGREKPNHTLQSIALVHEVYLRLANQKPKHFQDHSHFIAVAGQLMRQIRVDYTRNSSAIKRGGGAFKLRLDAVDGFPKTRDVDLLRLDDALKNLQEMDAPTESAGGAEVLWRTFNRGDGAGSRSFASYSAAPLDNS